MKFLYLKIFKHRRVWFIILIGLLIRLAIIDKHDFWFDEAFTVYISKHTLKEIINISFVDTSPPLFYLLLKFWLTLGDSPIYLRTLSLVFGGLNLWFTFKLTRLLFSEQVSFITTLLLTLSPLHAYYSIETRMYALWSLEITLLIYFFILWLEKLKKKYLTIFAFIAIISLYTHYFTWIILAALNLIYFSKRLTQKYNYKWIFNQILILLVCLPWLIYVSNKVLFSCHCFPFYIAIPTTLLAFVVNGLGIISLKTLFANHPPFFIQLVLVIQILTTFCFFIKGFLLVYTKPKSRIIIYLLLLPLSLVTLISFFYPLFSPRGFIPLTAMFYILVAVGLTRPHISYKSLFLIITFSLSTTLLTQQRPFYKIEPLQTGSQYISREIGQNDLIIHTGIYSYFPFIYYHRFLSLKEQLIVPYLFQSVILKNHELFKFENLNPNTSQIWLIHLPDRTDNLILAALQSKLSTSFQLNEKRNFANLQIYKYTKLSNP